MLDSEKDARTLFVRNISFDVDEPKLEEAFSDIGPVRQCFLVRNKGQQRHRGFGFVQYSIPEDAERAVQQLDGRDLHGRKIKVELAVKRASLEERKKRRQEAPVEDVAPAEAPAAKRPRPATAASAAQAAATAAKHQAVRTVALGGLPEGPALEGALQLARSAGGLVEVQDPPPPGAVERAHLAADGCSGRVVFLVYGSVKDAMHAVPQLHGQVVQVGSSQQQQGGSKKKKQKGKQQQQGEEEEAAGEAVVLWARQVAGEGARIKQYRVIIRNLPFQATEQHVRDLLQPAGFVWSLQLPRTDEGKLRGFAFASFTSYPDAAKAVSLCNGQSICKRPVAVDWALGKQQYQQLQQQQQQQQQGVEAGAAEGEGSKKAAGAAAGSEDEAGSDEGGLSEDGGASESEGELGLESSEEDGGGSSADEEEEEEGVEEEEGSGDEEAAMLHKVLSQVLETEAAPAQEEQEQPGSKAPPGKQPAAGGKAVSNKAAAEQQEGDEPPPQQQQQQQGGEFVSTTVFVRGLSLDVTQQELQAKFDTFGSVKSARLVVNKATNQPKGTAFIEYRDAAGAAAASKACAAARSGRGPAVTLKGRVLEVDLALSQAGARQLGANLSGLPQDKRNLYLAKEGHIEEGTKAWISMSEHDKAKRKRAAEERNTKLRSPNFFISTTRLSLRNIPRNWDEEQLRAACMAAVKARATKERPVIKQVRILKEAEGDPGARAGRSKGIGFVEFIEHPHAMAALRQLNNNPTAFGTSKKRPIVEFAIEDVKVLKKIEQWRQQRQRREQEAKEQGEQGQQQQQEAAAGGQRKPRKQRGAKQQQVAQGKGEEQVEGGSAGGTATAGALEAAAAAPDGQQDTRRKFLRMKDRRQASRERRKLENQQQKQQQQQQSGQPGQQQPPPQPRQQPVATRPQQQKQQQQRQQRQPPRQQQQQQQPKAGLTGKAGGAGGRRGQDGERQQQQQAQQRKRRADDALDALAAQPAGAARRGAQQPAAGAKRQRSGQKEETKLDDLVAAYKKRLFGAGGGGSRGAADGGSSLKRWFE